MNTNFVFLLLIRGFLYHAKAGKSTNQQTIRRKFDTIGLTNLKSFECQILYPVYLQLSKAHLTDLLKNSNTSVIHIAGRDPHFESL